MRNGGSIVSVATVIPKSSLFQFRLISWKVRYLWVKSELFEAIGEKMSTESSVGVIWVCENRNVMFVSDFARCQLIDGPMRIDDSGKLEVLTPDDQLLFWDLVQREIAGGLPSSEGLILGRNSDVQQFVSFAATQSDACAILVRSLAHIAKNSHEKLIGLFELTKREAQLALHLSSGRTLDDFARTNFLTKNTVKTHLKQLFKKVGTTKQMQLAVTVWAAIR